MYKTPKHKPTTIEINESYVAESIEKRVRRILNNKEPIQNEASLIYTSATEGIKPEFDIRTDKWEQAVEQMDKVTQMKIAQKNEKYKDKEAPVIDINKDKNTSDGKQQPKETNS